jgi:hypothetical protein
MEGKVARAFLYSDRNGHEVFSVLDVNDNLPIPVIGETIKLNRNRYVVESVRVVESRKVSNGPTQCHVCVTPLEDMARAAG